MLVELLYVDGCPNHEAALAVRRMLVEAGADASVVLRKIDSPQQAVTQRFPGSPTIRIDGVDIDPDGAQRASFGLQCRLYPGSVQPGVPGEPLLREALHHALGTGQEPASRSRERRP